MISLKQAKNLFIKLVALSLVFVLSVPLSVGASAADTVTPRASYYLDLYNAYICRVSGGIEIWYEVMGTGDMDEIGVLSIILYMSADNKNWSRVKTFSHEDYDTMLAEDDWYHASCVSYPGSANMYYKAYVCIWAGKNGDGDTRYMWAPLI